MAIDPSEGERVAGAHAIAHAQQLFVERVLKIIEDAATAQLAGHKLKAAQELIEDQEFVESIILNQATGN